jgi:hypothetical protein
MNCGGKLSLFGVGISGRNPDATLTAALHVEADLNMVGFLSPSPLSHI